MQVDQGRLAGRRAGRRGDRRPARHPAGRTPTRRPAELVVELLNRGVAPQSIWDALFDGAGELLMRQPGIVSLHAATTTNALHFAYQASADDETRRLLMLQNAAFLPLFREAMGGRGKVGDARIDQLEPTRRPRRSRRGRRGDLRRGGPATGWPPPARPWPTSRPAATRSP